MNAVADRFQAYLDDLARMLADLDPAERADVLDAVRGHLDDAVAELGHEPSAAEADAILLALGRPADIAAGAFDGARPRPVAPPVYVAPPRRPVLTGLWVPILVAVFLAAGVLAILVLPGILWLVGIVLLLASPLWTRSDKVIGVLCALAVVGLGLGGTIATISANVSAGSAAAGDPAPAPVETGGSFGFSGALIGVLGLATVAGLVWVLVRGLRAAMRR